MKKLYWLHELIFLDHCATINGTTKPMQCTVWGLIVGEDKDAYYVANWMSGGVVDENSNTNTILKKTIIKMKKLARINLPS